LSGSDPWMKQFVASGVRAFTIVVAVAFRNALPL
jgi:hypothetical protein